MQQRKLTAWLSKNQHRMKCEGKMKYEFINNKGEKILLVGKLTIKQLMEMGFREFALHEPREPIPDNRFIHNPAADNKKMK